MSDDIERALDAVASTARAHLAAVRAHGVDATVTTEAYDACADAALDYERLLFEHFGEAAPWATDLDDHEVGDDDDLVEETVIDPRLATAEEWMAVRVRADYFVEDEAAFLAAAEAAAAAVGLTEWLPVRTVPDAFAILLGVAAPVIGALDVPGLMRGNGVARVHATNRPLVDDDVSVDADEQAAFFMRGERALVVVPDLVPDDDDEAEDNDDEAEDNDEAEDVDDAEDLDALASSVVRAERD